MDAGKRCSISSNGFLKKTKHKAKNIIMGCASKGQGHEPYSVYNEKP